MHISKDSRNLNRVRVIWLTRRSGLPLMRGFTELISARNYVRVKLRIIWLNSTAKVFSRYGRYHSFHKIRIACHQQLCQAKSAIIRYYILISVYITRSSPNSKIRPDQISSVSAPRSLSPKPPSSAKLPSSSVR